MNHKARNELIEVISGLVMLVAGIFLIVSKKRRHVKRQTPDTVFLASHL